MLRSHVGYVVAASQLPTDELAQLHARLREELEAATGGRELAFEMRAWLALGRKRS